MMNTETTITQLKQIEQQTIGQWRNPTWSVIRKFRLTASKFGAVIEAYQKRSYPLSLFKSLLGEYDVSKVREIEWGRNNENENNH